MPGRRLVNFITKWAAADLSRVAVDASGNVFASDPHLDRIDEFTNTGTFVRTWGCMGSGDGTLNVPEGIAVDGNEHVFVADSRNNRIQKFGCP